ncbi:BRO family protein [Nostoc sp. 'Peltigera membranacea cyanobiont' N6]|uniref:BRO family protein n=1 Tax=Nostoc sp. 'Peltigera membranacea cyanobiont' N6 TaxID=1261031 RepID=UPI000CF31FAE|nr:BRO family protein [Nostoc sp. 'Peltigera membranacea cyanobiont' N6]
MNKIISDEIRKIDDPINPRWVAADICSLLDIDTSLAVTGQKRRPGSGLSEQEKFKDKIETLGGIQTLLTINREGLKRLLARSRKPNARTLARLFGIEVVLSCKEVECFSILAATFKHLAPKMQFCFDKYRIDFYLPSDRIAIECDEYGHSDRDKGYELISPLLSVWDNPIAESLSGLYFPL